MLEVDVDSRHHHKPKSLFPQVASDPICVCRTEFPRIAGVAEVLVVVVKNTQGTVEHDNIYALPMKKIGDFQFDQQVVDVFPDMISRSVPGYASILSMIGEIAERYVPAGGVVYDLGCSLGACTRVVRGRVPADCRIIAVDSSQAMVEEFGKNLEQNSELCRVEIRLGDILELEITEASLSVLNFTLQFIPKEKREHFLARIARGTCSGGALVLSEKVRFPDEDQQALLTELHHDFKRANGYSELEIAQKRTALEKTLIPETIETHLERLRRVGFSTVTCWFQCFNFVSILAVK